MIFLLSPCWGVVGMSLLTEITDWKGGQSVVIAGDTSSVFFMFAIICFTSLHSRCDNCNCLHLIYFSSCFCPITSFWTSDSWRNNLWWSELGTLPCADSSMHSLVLYFWRTTQTAMYEENSAACGSSCYFCSFIFSWVANLLESFLVKISLRDGVRSRTVSVEKGT